MKNLKIIIIIWVKDLVLFIYKVSDCKQLDNSRLSLAQDHKRQDIRAMFSLASGGATCQSVWKRSNSIQTQTAHCVKHTNPSCNYTRNHISLYYISVDVIFYFHPKCWTLGLKNCWDLFERFLYYSAALEFTKNYRIFGLWKTSSWLIK